MRCCRITPVVRKHSSKRLSRSEGHCAKPIRAYEFVDLTRCSDETRGMLRDAGHDQDTSKRRDCCAQRMMQWVLLAVLCAPHCTAWDIIRGRVAFASLTTYVLVAASLQAQCTHLTTLSTLQACLARIVQRTPYHAIQSLHNAMQPARTCMSTRATQYTVFSFPPACESC